MTDLAEPRQRSIVQLVNADGQVVVSELARRFAVSEMTIRRDLKTLESMGLVLRVHGGAMAGEKSRFSNRLSTNARYKAKAAQKLADMLPEAGSVYFDGSTTVLNLVKHLRGRTRLQVATNNVETFNRLAAVKGPTPILLGGSLDLRTDNLIGPLAHRSIQAMAFEKSFFSAWGLSPEAGLSEVTMEDARVKELVAERSKAVLVAVDHSKLGVVAGGVWRHATKKSVLATDLSRDDARLQAYAAIFGEVI